MRRLLLLVLACCAASAAVAQTGFHVQTVALSDPCAEIDPVDLGNCGLEAFSDKNYAAARRAWSTAARDGDYLSARWLGQMYREGRGTARDAVQAYAWFDIAATLHARAIDRDRRAGAASTRESNKAEIDARDAVGRKMPPTEVARAEQLASDWLKINSRS